MSALQYTIDAGEKDCIYYKVKRVLLWWDPPEEQMEASGDSDKERDLFSDSDDDEEVEEQTPGQIRMLERQRVREYNEALEEWRAKSSTQVDWWLDVGWVTFAVFNGRALEFLAEQHLTYPVSNLYNALCFRRAMLLSLRSVECFRGELTQSMMEASNYFLTLGYVRVADVPDDLLPRVESAVAKLQGMDEQDLATCYVGGSHWMIHEFRTLESMIEPARGIGFDVFLRPVFRRISNN